MTPSDRRPVDTQPAAASGGWREMDSFIVHTLMTTLTVNASADDVLVPCFDMLQPGAGPVKARIHALIEGPLTLATILVGCLGSIYTLAIVGKLRLQKSLVTYLITLVFWDVSLLVVSCLYYSIASTLALFDITSNELTNASTVIHGLGKATMCGEVWLTLTISIVRYIAVCYPMWQNIKSLKAARCVCWLVSAAAILFALPAFFELRSSQCARFDEHGGLIVKAQAVPTSLRRNRTYLFVYRTVLQIALISLVPLVVILIASVRMMMVIRKEQKRREQMTGLLLKTRKGQRLSRTNVMLLLLLTKFLCCHTLPTLLNIWETFFSKHYKSSPPWFLSTVVFSNYLVVFNSATNFIIYFWWQKTASPSNKGTRCATGGGAVQLSISRGEARILADLWHAALERHGDALGMRILTNLLVAKSHLRVHFGMRPGEDLSRAEMCENAMVKKQAERIAAFLGQLIEDLCHDHDPKMIAARIRHVGRVHFERGVNFTNAIWLEFRKCMLELLLVEPDKKVSAKFSRSETELHIPTNKEKDEERARSSLRRVPEQAVPNREMKIVRRFVSLIICEMKNAFFNEAQKHHSATHRNSR